MFIYENCVLLNFEASEEARKQVISQIQQAVEEAKGEILFTDEWGARTLAEPTARGHGKGYYIYFLYKADGQVNKELERRFGINESVIKYIILKKGPESALKAILKSYVTPYASNAEHRPSEEELSKDEKEKRLFVRRKSCYFKANQIGPDWKNPHTYKWLVNEFGKISPARVTGLSARYQRSSATAIKMARCMGLVSHVSRNFVF